MTSRQLQRICAKVCEALRREPSPERTAALNGASIAIAAAMERGEITREEFLLAMSMKETR